MECQEKLEKEEKQDRQKIIAKVQLPIKTKNSKIQEEVEEDSISKIQGHKGDSCLMVL